MHPHYWEKNHQDAVRSVRLRRPRARLEYDTREQRKAVGGWRSRRTRWFDFEVRLGPSGKSTVSEEMAWKPMASLDWVHGRVQSASADSGEVGNHQLDGGKWACVQIVSPRMLVAV